eukprot:1021063_1
MTAGMQVHSSYDITLINNSFAGFDRKGLLDFYDADNIFLKDNTFNVNADQLFYNVPQKHLQFRFAPLNFEHCTNTTTISNEFQQRNMGYYNWFEWIMYRNNYGTNCLSANIFVNRAFRSYKTNITSCLRPFVFMIYFMCYGVATEEEHVLGDVLDNEVKTNTIKQIQLSSTQGHQIEEK